jgi:hypothetical protein
MARIRSIHPNQWTDEAFVELTFAARLLAIALRNEADDQGVFEWKPKALKMRLMPADNVDVAELLAELAEHNVVKSYEHEGRKYGAIRNFGRFQKPRRPNCTHPVPDEIREYAGFKEGAFPTMSEQGAVKEASFHGGIGEGIGIVKNAHAREGALSRSNGNQAPTEKPLGMGMAEWREHLRANAEKEIKATKANGGGHA